MQVIINGEGKNLPEKISITTLIEQIGINTNKAAIEVNLRIIPRSHYGQTILQDGDNIEIVQFMGGG